MFVFLAFFVVFLFFFVWISFIVIHIKFMTHQSQFGKFVYKTVVSATTNNIISSVFINIFLHLNFNSSTNVCSNEEFFLKQNFSIFFFLCFFSPSFFSFFHPFARNMANQPTTESLN